MGKSSRRKRSRSPRSHKRRKRASSRDSSGEERGFRRPVKYRSHSREVSRSDSLDRILELITEQGNRIARIEANAHVPRSAPDNTSACAPPGGLDAPGAVASPRNDSGRPADVSAVQEDQENQHSVPSQPHSDQPEEVRSTLPADSGLQAEGSGVDARNCSVSFAPLSPPDESGNKASKRASELFGPCTDPPVASTWDQTALAFARDTVHKGLPDALRSQLLTEHEVKGDLSILGPPKLNKLLLPTLKGSTSALKRDEAQATHQSQLAAALNAIGSGVSKFLSEEVDQMLSEEARKPLQPIAEGIQLLADLQYRLSLQRRAFIKPALNFLGKNTADSAPIDDWLFGSSFAEDIKEAKACEKVARELTYKPKPAISKAAAHQPARAQPQPKLPSTSGNSKGPTRRNNPPHRRSGAWSKDRSRRSSSRSRHRR
ncbi:uncharacterized protein LOC143904563 [Temnothorax americanus]|uniref:uncharacterized protein LOC143904563 n=1 Tax=Temnothorax americanus TaxID=1964332 RepID=UPI0040688D25